MNISTLKSLKVLFLRSSLTMVYFYVYLTRLLFWRIHIGSTAQRGNAEPVSKVVSQCSTSVNILEMFKIAEVLH